MTPAVDLLAHHPGRGTTTSNWLARTSSNTPLWAFASLLRFFISLHHSLPTSLTSQRMEKGDERMGTQPIKPSTSAAGLGHFYS